MLDIILIICLLMQVVGLLVWLGILVNIVLAEENVNVKKYHILLAVIFPIIPVLYLIFHLAYLIAVKIGQVKWVRKLINYLKEDLC